MSPMYGFLLYATGPCCAWAIIEFRRISTCSAITRTILKLPAKEHAYELPKFQAVLAVRLRTCRKLCNHLEVQLIRYV
jgi:hypothetical protein